MHLIYIYIYKLQVFLNAQKLKVLGWCSEMICAILENWMTNYHINALPPTTPMLLGGDVNMQAPEFSYTLHKTKCSKTNISSNSYKYFIYLSLS